jgi:hypothetical protein
VPGGGQDACQGDSGGPLIAQTKDGEDEQVRLRVAGSSGMRVCWRHNSRLLPTSADAYLQTTVNSPNLTTLRSASSHSDPDAAAPATLECEFLFRGIPQLHTTHGNKPPQPSTPAIDPPRSYTDVIPYVGWLRRQLDIAAWAASSRPLAAFDGPAPAPAPAPAARPAPAYSNNILNPAAAPPAAAPPAAAPPAAAVPADACACTADGVSGGVDVGRAGCKQHGIANGDGEWFCYVVAPRACGRAVASSSHAGAAWVGCRPAEREAAAAAAVRLVGSGLPASRLDPRVATRIGR